MPENRLDRFDGKLDELLKLGYETKTEVAKQGSKLDAVKEETDKQQKRLDNHGKRIGDTEKSLSWIKGGVALIGFIGATGLGGIVAWVKGVFGGGNA